MTALLAIQDERHTLLRMHGYNSDPLGVNKLLDWCDPRQTLKASWMQCGKFAERCRLLNDRNAALVAARMKRVEGLLEVIVGSGKQANVYSAAGTQDAGRSGVMFAAEA
jgi:flagellar biosynthesis/type III secretory pathway chaperone